VIRIAIECEKKISPQIPHIDAEKKLYGRNQESAEICGKKRE